MNQPLQNVHIDKRDAVVVPLADTIALFGALNELTVLRRQAFEAMKTQGLTDSEAVEILNEPGVLKQLNTMAERKEKRLRETFEIQERFEKAKAEAARPIQQTNDILTGDDPRSLEYRIILMQEEEATETAIKQAAEEYKQELREIEVLPITVCTAATPEFLRVTSRKKFFDSVVSWGCKWLPFYGSFLPEAPLLPFLNDQPGGGFPFVFPVRPSKMREIWVLSDGEIDRVCGSADDVDL